jgi:hypothetical protein
LGQSSGLAQSEPSRLRNNHFGIAELGGLHLSRIKSILLAGVVSCNTSKATVDTFAKFTSSTSPGGRIIADGVVRDSHKARMFTAVAFENLGKGADQVPAHARYRYA